MRHNLDDKKEEVLERLDLGVPQTRVAQQFGVTIEQLRYWLRKNSDPKAAK